MLVLANLGLLPLAACKQEDVHVTDPVSIPTAETASASAPASASASAPAPASASASASGLAEDACRVDQDCGAPYKQCVHLAGEKDGIGRCEIRKNYHLGRPLVADGAVHLAPYASAPAISSAELAALLDAAREEHASIAAFARTLCELMALGAPAWLLSETQTALADEIRHTEGTLDLVERATGERPRLGPLEASVAPLRRGPRAAEDLFRDVFRGGAVGETLAAARAEELRASATDEALRAFYDGLVRDESRHAALALKTLRWLLELDPSLVPVLAQERARFEGSEPAHVRALVGPLVAVLG
jgi:hypothetical protein